MTACGNRISTSEITDQILATLAKFPQGLTTPEIAELIDKTSYHTSGKLSKLAAYGIIDKRPGTTKKNFRWAAKRTATNPA